MEALSLKLYMSACALGFKPIGTTAPPLPEGAFQAGHEAQRESARAL